MRKSPFWLVPLLVACHDATSPRQSALTCGVASGATVPATVLDLSVGSPTFLNLSAAQASCLQFAPHANSVYLFTLFNTDTSSRSAALVKLHGSSPDSAHSARVVAAAPEVLPVTATSNGLALSAQMAGMTPAEFAAGQALHARLLTADRQLVQRRGGPAALKMRAVANRLAFARRDRTLSRDVSTVKVGDTLSFRIRDIRYDSDCSLSFPVRARAVYSGPHSVIYEDVAAPLAGTMDDAYAAIGAEFDSLTYPMLVQYFGDPLAYGPQLRNGGKEEMLFSPVLNDDFSGVAGFVTACDFFPVDTAAGPDFDLISNEAAIFYAYLPERPEDEARWFGYIRGVLAHESKHLASYAAHLNNGAASFEEEWLEESTAQTSAEIFQRRFSGTSWKHQATFAATVGCEPPLTQVNGCAGDHPEVMLDHFAFLYDYLSNVASESPILGGGSADYGGSWSFVRWALDQYVPSEAGALHAMTQSTTLTGIPNLVARTNQPFGTMVADWSLASVLAGYPEVTPTSSRYVFRGWDDAGIFQGMHDQLFYTTGGRAFPRVYPLQPQQLHFGEFDFAVRMPGGGSAYFELDSPTAMRESVQLVDPFHETLLTSGPIRAVVVRIQ